MSVSGVSSLLGNSSLFNISSLSSTDMGGVQNAFANSSSSQPGMDSASISPMAQQMNSLMSLGKALQSGDLSDAQSAYTSFIDAIQSSGNSNSPFNSNGQLSQDVNAVSSALQSGDLSGAQNAFAALQKDLQGLQKTGHHHHRGGGPHANSQVQQQMQDLNNLDQALQSGDATSSQSAFSTLLQAVQNNSSSNSWDPFTDNTQASSDLQNIQSALQSGDMNAANSAFASLQQDLLPPGVSSSNSNDILQSATGSSVDSVS